MTHKLEWATLLSDLEALQYTEVKSEGKRFLLRSDLVGHALLSFGLWAWPSRPAFSESSRRTLLRRPCRE